MPKLPPAIAQGALTPQTRIAYEQARRDWQLAKLIDSLTFDGYEDATEDRLDTLLAA